MRETPSRTARKVATNVVMLAADPRTADVLPAQSGEATERLLLAAGVVSEGALRFAHSNAARRIMMSFDWMMPGQFEGFARRKQFCDQQVRRAIDDGATQVLVLGAGYDTLTWRLSAEFADVQFFEIDHPATARAKAKGIDALGAPDNLHLVAEDLAQKRLADVLAALPAWRRDARSAVVAEGLLMYLPANAVRELFGQVATSTAPQSCVVFSHVDVDAKGQPDAGPWSRLTRLSLRLMGEPWLWGHAPGQLGAFLEPLGWRLDGTPERAGIEHLAVAMRVQ